MLNHSCTRCRSKKLRCDGSSPCGNCRAKGISHVCQRAQRKERPRKSAANALSSKPPPSSTSPSVIDEITAGASSLARLHVRTDTERSSASGPESEEPTRSPSSTISTSSSSRKGYAVAFTPAPPHFRGCLVTPRHIADARDFIGALHPALRLINYVFQWRCQSMAHSCVHLPTIKHTLRQLYSDEWAGELAQDQLALALMAVAMSIQFSPRRGPYAHVFQVVQALGPAYDPAERQQRIHQLARSIVQSRLLDANTSLEGVQTIVLLLIYDLDEESFKERLWMSAVRCAQSLELNHIQHERDGGVPSLESELGVRVWWFLVCRDWLYALARGSYKLHPNHFTTRLPMIITDDDLTAGGGRRHLSPAARQAGEVSPVSVSIPFIGLASLIRDLVDIKPERTPEEFSQEVANAFDLFVETLPLIFSLSTTHIAALDDNLFVQQRLESERWLLHQQIFHAYMHFDELRLDRPICPQMVALASHTLQLQDRVRARCHIIDSMRINVTGVLRAITVLTIDLLQKHRDSKVSLARQVTLGKIKEAIHKCEASPNLAEGDLDNVYKLIEMEESAWAAKSRAVATTDPPRKSFFTILNENAAAAGSAPVLTPPTTATTSSASASAAGGPPSFSGTASEGGSVETTSPVVDMPVVPMDLPVGGSSSSNGGGPPLQQHVQYPQQQQYTSEFKHPHAHAREPPSIPSVLLDPADYPRAHGGGGHGGGEGLPHERRDSDQSSHSTTGTASGGGGMYPLHPPLQHSQPAAAAPFPSGLPGSASANLGNGLVRAHDHSPSFYGNGNSSGANIGMPDGVGVHHAPYGHSHGHAPQTHGAPFHLSNGALSQQQQQQQQQQQPQQPQQQQQHYAHHASQPRSQVVARGAPPADAAAFANPPANNYQHHQAHHAQHAHHAAQSQPHQPQSQPHPHSQSQYLDVAQWASLVPSDQAVSPIFAPDLLAAHQPSLEDLYATFIS